MSTFNATSFRVIPDDRGNYPLPARDGDGIPHYRAKIRPIDEAAYKAIQDSVSIVTTRRGRGAFNFLFSVDAGPGEAALSVPVSPTAYGAFDAILVSFVAITGPERGIPGGVSAPYYEADADFIVTSDDITP